MARRVGVSDPDRHLSQRNGFFTYKRRVPATIGQLDSRFPVIRTALKTNDLGEARLKRDAYERADDQYWASLCEGSDHLAAEARYKAAVARASALGFTYRHLSSILAEESGGGILARLKAVQEVKPGSPDEAAILGAIERPRVSLQRAFEIYVDTIVAVELKGKSPGQRKRWLSVKKRAVTYFEKVCGARNIDDITREDALTFHAWWLARIAPNPDSGKRATHRPNSGNRDIGNLRVLYQAYFKHMNVPDAINPFDNLYFSDKKSKKAKKKRASFTDEWITGVILKPGALATLNKEARGILLTLIETGARPSEIGNLREEQIKLSDPVPHLVIEPSDDPDEPFEIKTESSIRKIPLVGVALEAMKKFPKGFPRYRDRPDDLSATLGKYLREHGLFPTKNHVTYSFRHTFEDRAKNSNMDAEMRLIVMGHTIDRPQYGEGGSLEWKLEALSKMALPFDPSIV